MLTQLVTSTVLVAPVDTAEVSDTVSPASERPETSRPAPHFRARRAYPKTGKRAVVMGGGITGNLTALELAKKGWGVTVLEAAHWGSGSSSRTAGGIRQQWDTPATVQGMMYAMQYYLDMQKQTGQPIVTQNGYLFLLKDDQVAGAKKRVAMQKKLGLGVELLDRAGLSQLFPYINAEGYAGATWCPSDGFLHPQNIYNDAAAMAAQLGATMLQNAPVIGATHDGHGRLRSVKTPKGEFEADVFFDATNAWTPDLGLILGATDLAIERRRRYLWFTRRQEGSILPNDVLARMPLTIDPSGLYWRPAEEGALLFARIDTATDAPDPDFSRDGQDRIPARWMHNNTADDAPAMLARIDLAGIIPDTETYGPYATTAGYYGVAPGHNPYLDFDPAVPNLGRLVGFSGHGAMFGPFSALMAVAMAEAGRSVGRVRIPGGNSVSVAAFRTDRDNSHGENMVI